MRVEVTFVSEKVKTRLGKSELLTCFRIENNEPITVTIARTIIACAITVIGTVMRTRASSRTRTRTSTRTGRRMVVIQIRWAGG